MASLGYTDTEECEFVGGPLDGLEMRIYKTRDSYMFTEFQREIVTPKSCGMSVIQSPVYTRISNRRFEFVGYK